MTRPLSKLRSTSAACASSLLQIQVFAALMSLLLLNQQLCVQVEANVKFRPRTTYRLQTQRGPNRSDEKWQPIEAEDSLDSLEDGNSLQWWDSSLSSLADSASLLPTTEHHLTPFIQHNKHSDSIDSIDRVDKCIPIESIERAFSKALAKLSQHLNVNENQVFAVMSEIQHRCLLSLEINLNQLKRDTLNAAQKCAFSLELQLPGLHKRHESSLPTIKVNSVVESGASVASLDSADRSHISNHRKDPDDREDGNANQSRFRRFRPPAPGSRASTLPPQTESQQSTADGFWLGVCLALGMFALLFGKPVKEAQKSHNQRNQRRSRFHDDEAEINTAATSQSLFKKHSKNTVATLKRDKCVNTNQFQNVIQQVKLNALDIVNNKHRKLVNAVLQQFFNTMQHRLKHV